MNIKYDKILDCLREEDTVTSAPFVGIKNHLKLGGKFFTIQLENR